MTKLLLDTHVVIWLALEQDKVPRIVQDRIGGADEVCVSVVSAWEYGLKRTKYPDQLSLPFERLIEGSDVERLPLPFACHRYSETLPPIHSDPFDRMLVAHARHLDCALVTGDGIVSRYPVRTLW